MKMTRRAGAATIELVPDDGGLDLAVSYDLGNGTWIGIASFPWELEDEALLWLERIRSAASNRLLKDINLFPGRSHLFNPNSLAIDRQHMVAG